MKCIHTLLFVTGILSLSLSGCRNVPAGSELPVQENTSSNTIDQAETNTAEPSQRADSSRVRLKDEYEAIGNTEMPSYNFKPSSKQKYYSYQIQNMGSNYDPHSEEYSGIEENDYKEVKVNPLSTFSADVDAASYSNVRRFLQNGEMPRKDAIRIEELINYFDYDYPEPKGDAPFSITTEMADCPWNTKHKLVHIGIQGERIDMQDLKPSNLVFLIDVSGSMEESNRLPLVKKSLRLLVENMGRKDKIAIVTYAGSAGIALKPTPAYMKDEIYTVIENLEAGGATAGSAGIETAYKLAKENFVSNGNNRVILATDGDFNLGISDNNELEKLIVAKRNEGVSLTVLGFGMGNLKDNRLEMLADKGNGNYAYIDNLLEAQKVLVNEMGATLQTIAKDVKIQVEFNPAKVYAYRLVGYENRLMKSEDFNDDTKDAGDLGAGHNVTALYEIVPVGVPLDLPKTEELKYQKTVWAETDFANTDAMTIKLRYKDPDGTESKLLSHVVTYVSRNFNDASETFRFSAAVAEWGMVLRNSTYKGTSTFASVLSLAKNSKGKDEQGYRAEFVRLVGMSELLLGKPEEPRSARIDE